MQIGAAIAGGAALLGLVGLVGLRRKRQVEQSAELDMFMRVC